jgi:hypothetical protein
MLRITPHPAFAIRVSARRGALDFAPALAPFAEEKVWKAFADHVIGGRNHWVTRIGGNPDVKSSLDMLKKKALPAPFDVRLVALVERFMPFQGHMDGNGTLVRLVAERVGLLAMVEMKLESTAILLLHNEAEVHFDADGKGWNATENYDASWMLARTLVCRASDSDYARAKDVAAKWRAARPVSRRLFADYLFPEEPEWANEDLDESLKVMATDHDFCRRAFALVASANDPARVLRFIDALNDYQTWSLVEHHACDLAVALPPADAVRVLCKLLEKCKRAGKTQLAVLGHAMCAVEAEEMAAELAGLLLHSPIGPLAVDYFKRFPSSRARCSRRSRRARAKRRTRRDRSSQGARAKKTCRSPTRAKCRASSARRRGESGRRSRP